MNLHKEMLYTAKDGALVLLRYPLEKDSMQLMSVINELIDEHAPIGANKKVNRKQEEEYVRNAIKEIKEKKRIQFLAEIDKKIVANIGINRLYGKLAQKKLVKYFTGDMYFL